MLRLLQTLAQTGSRIHPGFRPDVVFRRAKYYLRGLAFPAATAEWFKLLETPALAAVVRRRPELFQKPQRPYLTSTLRTEQRLQMLTHHYQFIVSHFPPELLREIHAYPGKCLATLPGHDGGQYELRLMSSWTEREGELVLMLRNQASGEKLFTLTFAITRCSAGGCEILIGGLQGNRQANDKELIVALTRHWHGLRPRALLLFALHQLAAMWNATRVRAVGDASHVYRLWKKGGQMAFCYDDWWQETGGQLAADGLFDLPARFVPRDIATVKTNKRSMYRHRYLMLEDLGRQIADSLGCAPQPRWAPENPAASELRPPLPVPSLVARAA